MYFTRDFKPNDKIRSAGVRVWDLRVHVGVLLRQRDKDKIIDQLRINYKMPSPSTVEKLRISQDKVRVKSNLNSQKITRRNVISCTHFIAISGQQRLSLIPPSFGDTGCGGRSQRTQGTTEGLFFLLAFPCPKPLLWAWVTSRGRKMQFHHVARRARNPSELQFCYKVSDTSL